jgi:poly-gamma-glutamate synthesis protein (capsule biosynthesis protein)
VTIAFAGDASFEGLGQLVEDEPEAVLAGVGPLLRGADLAVVNLEAVLGDAGSPVPKAFNFRVPAGALESLSAAASTWSRWPTTTGWTTAGKAWRSR